jgi:hypothetical protein
MGAQSEVLLTLCAARVIVTGLHLCEAAIHK